MATVTGPLHSDGAFGQFDKSIIFKRSRGRTVAKAYAVPRLTRTDPQRAIRAINQFLTSQWKNTLTTEKETWSELAARNNTTPIAEFCRYNFARIWDGKGPTKSWPATEAAPYGGVANWTATGGRGIVKLTARWSTAPRGWATMIYSLAAVGVPKPQQIVAIFSPGIYPLYEKHTVANVLPGNYVYYKRQFSIAGLIKLATGVTKAPTVT